MFYLVSVFLFIPLTFIFFNVCFKQPSFLLDNERERAWTAAAPAFVLLSLVIRQSSKRVRMRIHSSYTYLLLSLYICVYLRLHLSLYVYLSFSMSSRAFVYQSLWADGVEIHYMPCRKDALVKIEEAC